MTAFKTAVDGVVAFSSQRSINILHLLQNHTFLVHHKYEFNSILTVLMGIICNFYG